MIRSGQQPIVDETEPESFGRLLRRARLAAGLSQERLAERARISPEAVSALERGTRKAPQRQTLALLVDALALSDDEREALTLAAVRPPLPRLRAPRADQPALSFLLAPPSALTSFVGRDDDVAKVLRMCATARLTTLVGPGGIGKSRLALEIARRAAGDFAGGVAVAALAPLMPGASVLPTIAVALGIRDEGTGDLFASIDAALGERRVLLVLDNCEHVLDEVVRVAEALLAGAPGVHLIATSRERLRVDGERVYRLQPLSIEHAVDVFIDRAAANGYDPAANEAELSIAAEICDRLDRMPLAIELAASCSNVLALEAILTRLRERAALPAVPKRLALPQHRSLQGLVEWSYDRLEPVDAAVFRHLAPFAGGCRLDDAQDIIATAGRSKDDVLYALFRLHEQSLVDADRGETPRFQMLQTIADIASSKLTADERDALTRRFALHYFQLAASRDAVFRSGDQNPALDRIAADASNVRAALRHLHLDAEVSAAGLRALGALSHYWLRTGMLTEGSHAYATANLAAFEPSVELAAAVCGGAFVEINRRDFPTAHAYAVRARAIADAIDHPWFRVYAAVAEHTIGAISGGFITLTEPFEPYYRQAQALGDPWLLMTSSYRMGQSHEVRDLAERTRYFESGLAYALETGDAFAIQALRLALAAAWLPRDPRRAAAFIEAVWTHLDRASLYMRRWQCVECLADIAVALERPDDAAALVGIGLMLLRQMGGSTAARAHLETLAQRLRPAHERIIREAESLTAEEAGERVVAFLASVSGRSSGSS